MSFFSKWKLIIYSLTELPLVCIHRIIYFLDCLYLTVKSLLSFFQCWCCFVATEVLFTYNHINWIEWLVHNQGSLERLTIEMGGETLGNIYSRKWGSMCSTSQRMTTKYSQLSIPCLDDLNADIVHSIFTILTGANALLGCLKMYNSKFVIVFGFTTQKKHTTADIPWHFSNEIIISYPERRPGATISYNRAKMKQMEWTV